MAIIAAILLSIALIKSVDKIRYYPYTIVTLFINGRGDYVDPGPIEVECQARMEREYLQSSELKKRDFSECQLFESRVGSGPSACPNGESPQGCSICKLKCK